MCTYTNVAVDNLVEGFARSGVKPLRIGYGKVRPSLLEHTLDHKLSKHALKPKLEQASAELERVEKQLKPLSDDIDKILTKGTPAQLTRLEPMKRNYQRLENLSGRLKAKEYAIYQEMLGDIVRQADVVCSFRLSSLFLAHWLFLGMYNLYHICFSVPQCDRLSRRVPGRSFDVNRTCLPYPHYERRT